MAEYSGRTIPKTAPNTQELIKRHAAYLPTHKPFPTIKEIQATGTMPPKTVIITCVDPRVFPEELLGLKMGEAFIFRTIAGHPQPIFEQLIGLDRTSFNFEDVWLLYHTDCGAQYFDEEKIRSGLLQTDANAEGKIDAMDFGTMTGTVEESLREDMAWLKSHATVRQGLRDAVRGFMWDIKSGELREVK